MARQHSPDGRPFACATCLGMFQCAARRRLGRGTARDGALGTRRTACMIGGAHNAVGTGWPGHGRSGSQSRQVTVVSVSVAPDLAERVDVADDPAPPGVHVARGAPHAPGRPCHKMKKAPRFPEMADPTKGGTSWGCWFPTEEDPTGSLRHDHDAVKLQDRNLLRGAVDGLSGAPGGRVQLDASLTEGIGQSADLGDHRFGACLHDDVRDRHRLARDIAGPSRHVVVAGLDLRLAVAGIARLESPLAEPEDRGADARIEVGGVEFVVAHRGVVHGSFGG